jgi:peptidoglycan/xylan/chitin deacetylase (PgdA/CDA1 family)
MVINIAICLDIDRDAPFPIFGVSHGVCLPYHDLSPVNWKDPEKFTIKGTILGLKRLVSIFDNIRFPFNCFIEASIIEKLFEKYPEFIHINENNKCDLGLHGLHHEDISGEQTGISFSRTQEENLLTQAIDTFVDFFGFNPIGYRAPYLKISANTYDILSEKKFLYDSSEIVTANSVPQIKFNKITEVPILRYKTNSKPFISYLWTLFEGIRSLDKLESIYTEIIENTKNLIRKVNPDEPYILTLNLHPWHLAYSVRERQYITDKRINSNINSLMKISEMLNDIDGVFFVKISDIVSSNL